MKNKIKKWHIALMSFILLFVAIFASLFSLRADTVDEETGEIVTDNWELGIVFYDSSVGAGKTPLTELNWDASNGSYLEGTPREITVQINYKNSSAATTYQPGELEISIPKLNFSSDTIPNTAKEALWKSSVLIGANDATHTGYDWTLIKDGEILVFTNAITIEEKTNFEGSIQIKYNITPNKETPEAYLDECLHSFSKTLKAVLSPAGQNISIKRTLSNIEHTITSPNWPEKYPSNLNSETTYWEYTKPGAEKLYIYFDDNSHTYVYDHIQLYDKTGYYPIYLSGTQMAGKVYVIEGDYVKIKFSSGYYTDGKGFAAYISSDKVNEEFIIPDNTISSNEINFNYSRLYTHKWTKQSYPLTKTAAKITSFDGLGENASDYIWVKYTFNTYGYFFYDRDAKIVANSAYIKDVFPEECVVYNSALNNITQTDSNIYHYNVPIYKSSYHHSYSPYLYVGYPKSIYNDENLNLNIVNTADLMVRYNNSDEFEKAAEASVNVNLNEFNFSYSGNLFTQSKSFLTSTDYHSYKLYYNNLIGEDLELGNKGICQSFIYNKVLFSGTPMDIIIGDDLLYVTTENGYKRLLDYEYYFSSITFPTGIKNGNNVTIPAEKYECELWVRYAGDLNYTLYEEFLNQGKTWTLTKEQQVVAFYFKIKNVQESIITNSTVSTSGTTSSDLARTINSKVVIRNCENISESGYIYNFSFLQIFINGILQNATTLDSYSSLVTKEEIATYDMSTYGTYIQRSFDDYPYTKFSVPVPEQGFKLIKTMSDLKQDSTNEIFTGKAKVSINHVYANNPYVSKYISDNFLHTLDDSKRIKGYEFYDLLPEGMVVTSSYEEIINSITAQKYSVWVVDKTNKQLTANEFKELLIKNCSVEYQENWNNSNRTLIHIKIDLTECPLLIFHTFQEGSTTSVAMPIFDFSYKWQISYDAFLEYGAVWTNTIYGDHYINKFKLSHTTKDTYDFNKNGDLTETLAYDSDSITITSVISSHQDVTTFVKTDQNNYTTGIADSLNNSEYQYKLRVRTGAANVTNLILYTNLEEAQQGKSRWKGEFLGIDISNAENRFKIKTYYSENPAAGNLYNENGVLNSEWKVYSNETLPDLYQNGLKIKFNEQSKTENNCDYIEIYYTVDGTIYKTDKIMGNEIANKIIQIPSTNFYFYWHTDRSVSNYYGFTIDSITPTYVKDFKKQTGTIPSYAIEEIQDNIYPDSEFGSYTHGNYGDSVDKLWHYSYTGTLNKIQDAVTETDKTKVKSLAFEYLNEDGTPAIIPANDYTYVLINMKSPADENIKTLARMDCRTQWNALDEFDQPVDFITGINSNVVRVALPNSVDEDNLPSISLKFIKEIQGTDPEFENLKLDKAAQQTFMIRLTSLTENDDGSYNQVTALLKSDQELIISRIPIGTYLLEELGDNYFDFVEFVENNEEDIIIEGVTFERTDQGYIITVSEDLTETVEFNIKVTNEIEPKRFYEDKENKENIFLKNKIEENS